MGCSIGDGKKEARDLIGSWFIWSKQEVAPRGNGVLKINFHDVPLSGSEIERINLRVLETQIIDFRDEKFTVSDEVMEFNLLDLTANNPVTLAHASVPAGTYKQIRIILDPNMATLGLSDGSIHRLTVPSGNQSGIKLEGIFTVPEGQFYTLDIDMDPGKSVISTKGNGYMLKPVIEMKGENLLYGNFYYNGEFGDKKYVVNIGSDTSFAMKIEGRSAYTLKGNYVFDGINRELILRNRIIHCSSCLFFKDISASKAGIQEVVSLAVATFSADKIVVIKDGAEQILNKVDEFSLGNNEDIKTINLIIDISNQTGQDLEGKYLIGVLASESHIDSSSIISYGKIEKGSVGLDFPVQLSDIGPTQSSYILLVGVFSREDDFDIDYDGGLARINKPIGSNYGNLIRFHMQNNGVETVSKNILMPIVAAQ